MFLVSSSVALIDKITGKGPQRITKIKPLKNLYKWREITFLQGQNKQQNHSSQCFIFTIQWERNKRDVHLKTQFRAWK